MRVSRVPGTNGWVYRQNQSFSPFWFSLGSSRKHWTFCPRILDADVATEETNGFKDVYINNESRVMCWIHMLLNVDKCLKSFNAAHRNSLGSGILSIQLSGNSDIFN